MATDHVDLQGGLDLPVREAMISRPKSLPVAASVGDARRLFENPGVRVVMIVDDGRYAGELRRDHLPQGAADEMPLAPFVTSGESIAPDATVAAAIELLERSEGDRLAVVDHGRLVGLVCFSRSHGHLCVDARRG